MIATPPTPPNKKVDLILLGIVMLTLAVCILAGCDARETISVAGDAVAAGGPLYARGDVVGGTVATLAVLFGANEKRTQRRERRERQAADVRERQAIELLHKIENNRTSNQQLSARVDQLERSAYPRPAPQMPHAPHHHNPFREKPYPESTL
jgi:hypothetical protein